MDSKGFRLAPPDLKGPSRWAVWQQAQNEVNHAFYSEPADNSRYPAYGAQMDDGREFTDYRQTCQERVPAAFTRPVRLWMQRNAEAIIDLTRKRTAQNSGAVFPLANTTPPFENIVQCTPLGCTTKSNPFKPPLATGNLNLNAKAAPMFGTYQVAPAPGQTNPKNIDLNMYNEGGRNSVARWRT